MKIIVRFINTDNAEERVINQNFSIFFFFFLTEISRLISNISLIAEENNLCWLFLKLFLVN
jgi:hypothetical protein